MKQWKGNMSNAKTLKIFFFLFAIEAKNGVLVCLTKHSGTSNN